MINKAINFDDIFNKIHSNYVYPVPSTENLTHYPTKEINTYLTNNYLPSSLDISKKDILPFDLNLNNISEVILKNIESI